MGSLILRMCLWVGESFVCTLVRSVTTHPSSLLRAGNFVRTVLLRHSLWYFLSPALSCTHMCVGLHMLKLHATFQRMRLGGHAWHVLRCFWHFKFIGFD